LEKGKDVMRFKTLPSDFGSALSDAYEAPDFLDNLWREYHALVAALRKRRDPALELRLTVVMIDLGLYSPSPP
jgi:hypothetical protein